MTTIRMSYGHPVRRRQWDDDVLEELAATLPDQISTRYLSGVGIDGGYHLRTAIINVAMAAPTYLLGTESISRLMGMWTSPEYSPLGLHLENDLGMLREGRMGDFFGCSIWQTRAGTIPRNELWLVVDNEVILRHVDVTVEP